ncbi:MAG: VCBS repeat-containing protein, partial [Saprospiraceae bacterium]|nr:VCBS repeat-containing protein [Saprospiraceae bacterium]
MKRLFWILIILYSVWGCHQNATDPQEIQPPRQFTSLTEAQSGVRFVNTVTETPEFHHLLWESVFYGGGAAIGDINNDNLPDIYFTGNQVNDALYLNLGGMRFEDISEQAMIQEPGTWSTGVTMADVNADGLLDVYVCRSWWDLDVNGMDQRRNRLFINNGDLTFTERASEYGLDDAAYSTQATFFDYDRDGDLDMYLMNAPSNNFRQKLRYMQDNRIPYLFSDKLYENTGETFVDKTREAGIENYAFGLGLIASDINQDGWPDLYVACDYEQPDKLFINNRDGTFTDRSQYLLKHTCYSSMGCDIA